MYLSGGATHPTGVSIMYLSGGGTHPKWVSIMYLGTFRGHPTLSQGGSQMRKNVFFIDFKDYGTLSLSEVISKSSNVAMVKLCDKSNPEKIVKNFYQWGFGKYINEIFINLV